MWRNRYPARRGPLDATAATYAEMLGRVQDALSLGEMVILDASWSDRSRRADARHVATETASDLIELRCVAPVQVTTTRLFAWVAAGVDASDADANVARAMTAIADPWPTATAIDTTETPDAR